MPKFVIDWLDFNKNLPSGNDCAAKTRRRQLFDDFDPKGNGILFQAAVVRGLFRLYPRVGGMSETRSLINHAYCIARDTVPPIAPIGVDRMDRNQFRVLIVCLRSYIQLWEAFYNMKPPGDMTVLAEDIGEMQALFARWDVDNAGLLGDRLLGDFRRVNGQHSGAMPFEKFADCCLRRVLPKMVRGDEDVERREATQLLKRTHPHLFFERGERSPSVPMMGGVTRTLGMRPRHQVPKGHSAFDGGVTRYICSNSVERPGSVYMHDYRQPSPTGPSPMQPFQDGAAPQSGPPYPGVDGPTLSHSRSAPAASMLPARRGFPQSGPRTKATAHWSQHHTDMYNSKQMGALRAAGGIVLSPQHVR